MSDFGSLVQISIHTTLVSLIFSITEEDVVVHEGSGIEIGGLDNASIFLRSIIKIHGVTNGETFEPCVSDGGGDLLHNQVREKRIQYSFEE